MANEAVVPARNLKGLKLEHDDDVTMQVSHETFLPISLCAR